ncbi:Acyltransferase [Sphingomonas sp. 8AM]|nr:Acyltransferase [Sphingomonas sp. 8AM]
MRALNSFQTFGTILDKNRGAGKGFDLLRLGLALLILVSHLSSIVGHSGTTAWLTSLLFGTDASVHAATADVAARAPTLMPPALARPTGGLAGISGPFIRALVPMFFALSGFLVAGSALRTRKLLPFLGLRVLRIVPALFVEVFLSAIVLGAVFTNLPLPSYFSHPQFAAYFWNIVGVVQFHLPGVFQNNPDHVVNANLWTLPFELECYLVMSAFIILGVLRNRIAFTTLFTVATAALIVANMAYGYSAKLEIFSGRVLIYYFTCGVLFFLWRDRIPFSYVGLAVSLIVSYFLLRLTNATFITPFFLTYATAAIGLAELPQFKILKTGDYSYGIYLYSFPVSQAVVASMGTDALPYWVLVAVVTVLTCLFAAFSWHGVEKHFLKLKRFISKPSAKMTEHLHPTVVGATTLAGSPA